MKTAKSYKTIILAIVCALCFVLAFCPIFTNTTSASADTIKSADKYFSGLGNDKVEFADGFMVATVVEDSTRTENLSDPNNPNSEVNIVETGVLTISNELVVSDFEMVMIIPSNLDALTIMVKSQAYYANGNVYVKDGISTIEEEVINKFKFDFINNTLSVNDQSASAQPFTLSAENKLVINTLIENDYLKLIAGASNTEVVAGDIMDGADVVECRKIKNVANMASGTIKFLFDVSDAVSTTSPVLFKIESIDQKASDVNEYYKQTFETNSDGEITDDQTYPRVSVNEDFYKKNKDGSYSIIKKASTKYNLSFKVYSILANVSSSEVYIKPDANVVDYWTETGTDFPKAIQFNKVQTYSIDIAGKNSTVYETIPAISVLEDFSADDKAPEYVLDQTALEAFEVALKNAYYDVKGGHSTALGTSLTVPSLKDLVFDDYVAYEQLAKTVYYNTESSSDLSSTGMSISLTEAGKYNFMVCFDDGNGNKMDKERDFIVSENNLNPQYKDYVFEFKIIDDAPLSVDAAISQGVGYKGISYVASKFKVDAPGCNTIYRLYYNSSLTAVDSDEWTEIPSASTITDKEYDKDGYTYDDIKKINYTGGLTFTPDKLGSYKIVCTATSTVTSRSAEDYTIIRVSSAPSVVKVPSTWLRDNVWSVVFLSIGTLCLIGIVVLLCIKPKDEVDAD